MSNSLTLSAYISIMGNSLARQGHHKTSSNPQSYEPSQLQPQTTAADIILFNRRPLRMDLDNPSTI